MRTRARRVFFWLLLTAFAVALGWWLVHVPYRPERVFTAIPADALVVSRHHDLAGRWDTLTANPLARHALETFLGPGAVERLSEDRPFRTWLERLASDDLVFAYVPVGLRRERAVWTAATWVGSEGAWMRWFLAAGRVPGATRAGVYAGRVLWQFELPDLPPGQRLVLAIEEGVLMACVTDRPGDLRQLLDAYDGRAPAWNPALLADGLGAFPDRAWLSWRQGDLPRRVDTALARLDAGGLAGRVRVDPLSLAPAPAPPELVALGALLGDTADAAALLTPDALDKLAAAPGPLAQLRPALPFLERVGAPWVFAAVLRSDWSGRFHGLRVPAVVAACPVADEADAAAAIAGLFDRLNAAHQWGLIADAQLVGDVTMSVVESTIEGPYADLPENERLAFVLHRGWLVASSSAGALRAVLAHAAAQPAADAPPAWLASLADRKAAGSAWADLAPLSQTARLALSVYVLKLMVEQGDESAPLRDRLERAKSWAEAVAPLGTATLRLRADGLASELDFRMGDAAGPATGAESAATEETP